MIEIAGGIILAVIFFALLPILIPIAFWIIILSMILIIAGGIIWLVMALIQENPYFADLLVWIIAFALLAAVIAFPLYFILHFKKKRREEQELHRRLDRGVRPLE